MQKVIFPALSKSYIFSSDAFSKKLNKPRSKTIQHTYLISVTLFMLDTKIAPGRYRVIHINNILENISDFIFILYWSKRNNPKPPCKIYWKYVSYEGNRLITSYGNRHAIQNNM